MPRFRFAVLAAVALALTVVGANLLVAYAPPLRFLGLEAPAGVLLAGLAFTLRDVVQEWGGPKLVVSAILAGALLSGWTGLLLGEPIPGGPSVLRVALAGALAFAVSELVDSGVFSALRRRGWLRAVTASGAVGLVVDSVLFLAVAFGSLAFLPGQLVAKGAVLAATVLVLHLVRRRLARP